MNNNNFDGIMKCHYCNGNVIDEDQYYIKIRSRYYYFCSENCLDCGIQKEESN